MLSNPFLSQEQRMVAGMSQAPPQGGNQTHAHQDTSTSKKSNIYVVATEDVNIQTRGKNYEQK